MEKRLLMAMFDTFRLPIAVFLLRVETLELLRGLLQLLAITPSCGHFLGARILLVSQVPLHLAPPS